MWVKLESPGARLAVSIIGPLMLEMLIDEDGTLFWDREGEIRRVPRHALEDLHRRYHDLGPEGEGILTAEDLDMLCSLTWDQTKPTTETMRAILKTEAIRDEASS